MAGGICLLLAFFALQVLPVSYAGVLLILLGFALLILEVKVVSHGLLGVGGIASLLFGSLMLIDSPLPEMQIGLRLILPVTLSLSAILLFLVTLGRARAGAAGRDRGKRYAARTRTGPDARSTRAASAAWRRTGRSGPRPPLEPIQCR